MTRTIDPGANLDGWFVALVDPSCERLVADLLSAKGYETFVPTYLRRYRIRGHQKVMSLPLFARYVLCRVTPNVVGKVVGTPRVQRLLGFENGRGTIPQSEIDTLKKILDYGIVASNPNLRTGQMMEVIHGPLRGVVGRLVATAAAKPDRVVLSVDLVGQSVTVEVDACELKPY